MPKDRQPAVAGLFYPDEREALEHQLQELLDAVPDSDAPAPKALIAPHAGYVFSGGVAATAYARLRPARGRIRRVVLLGPAHRVPIRGLAAPESDRFLTPLGPVALDSEALKGVGRLPQVSVSEAAHAREHSLETQLPFLQAVLGDFQLVPLVVGDADPAEVAEVLETLWDGEETLIVISSDLSHFYDYDTARDLDSATAAAIAALRPEEIGFDNACGRIPVNGLLEVAARHGLHSEILDLRSSGDTAGPRDQVVGYGAFAFDEAAT